MSTSAELPLPAPVIPPLPADATPEQKDEHWRKYVYQGDRVPQLTLRAVLMGGVLGALLSISNLYTTLQLGWSFGVAITACVLSYVIWNAFRILSAGYLSNMSILENNCMQSTASAAGYSTGGTVGVALGALLLVQGEHLPWYYVTPFVFFSAALGVFIAIPMKRQMINHEQLPFPSGIAAAETLKSLYTKGVEAKQKATSLVIALGVGGLVGLLRTFETLLGQLDKVGRGNETLTKIYHAVQIPEQIPFTGWLNPLKKGSMTGLAFEPSVLLIGAGMIVGLRVSLSMFVASVVLYYGFAPWLLAHDVQQLAINPDYVRSFAVSPEGNFYPVRWALWGGTSIMVFSSLASLAFQWRTIGRAFTSFGSGTKSDVAGDSIEVPNTWLFMGLVPFGIGMVIVLYLAFQINIALGAISVALSFVASLVCCRATGETDTTPMGAVGKLTQLLYSVLPGAAGNTVTNLMSAGTTAAAGSASADLLVDLKSGYLLGANPRRQFLAQFAGIFFGTAAIVPAWYLMVPSKEAMEERFDLPATNMWKAVADLLTQGIHMLPQTARVAIVVGALIGIALPLIERFTPAKSRRFIPSAMGIGLAWVMPFQNAFAFAIGAVIAWIWSLTYPKTEDRFRVPIASGLVAGESLVAAVIAIVCTLVGFMKAG